MASGTTCAWDMNLPSNQVSGENVRDSSPERCSFLKKLTSFRRPAFLPFSSGNVSCAMQHVPHS